MVLKNESSEYTCKGAKRDVSDPSNSHFFTRFGVGSIFQRRQNVRQSAKNKRRIGEGNQAIITQTSFFGNELQCEILLRPDSDLWPKLSG